MLAYARRTEKSTINHVINRHGDPVKHGTAMVTNTDLEMIPAIVKKPDIAIIAALRWDCFVMSTL